MTALPQSDAWDAGIYQIEITDPVLGGVSGPANLGAKGLANRTVYLRNLMANLGVTFTWVEVMVTSTGTWTCPAGVTQIQIIEMVGGGGGGAAGYYMTNSGASGGGGGEGARVTNVPLTVVPSTVYTLTIGDGGTAGPETLDHGTPFTYDASCLGGNGGDTSFGNLLTAPGGLGGGDPNNTTDSDFVCMPGNGGSVTVNGFAYRGEPGHPGLGGSTASTPKADGGGRLGGRWWLHRTGGSTFTVVYSAPGKGCGGCGGNYGTYNGDAQAGGKGFIKFGYWAASVTGRPSTV